MKNSRLSAFPEDNPESRMVAYVVSFAGHVLAVTVPIAHWHLPVTRIFFFFKATRLFQVLAFAAQFQKPKCAH